MPIAPPLAIDLGALRAPETRAAPGPGKAPTDSDGDAVGAPAAFDVLFQLLAAGLPSGAALPSGGNALPPEPSPSSGQPASAAAAAAVTATLGCSPATAAAGATTAATIAGLPPTPQPLETAAANPAAPAAAAPTAAAAAPPPADPTAALRAALLTSAAAGSQAPDPGAPAAAPPVAATDVAGVPVAPTVPAGWTPPAAPAQPAPLVAATAAPDAAPSDAVVAATAAAAAQAPAADVQAAELRGRPVVRTQPTDGGVPTDSDTAAVPTTGDVQAPQPAADLAAAVAAPAQRPATEIAASAKDRAAAVDAVIVPTDSTSPSALAGHAAAHAPGHVATATPAAGGPAAPPDPVDTKSPQWHEALAGRIHWLVDHDVGEARIKLNPPELGALDVKISVQDDKTFVQVTAHSAAARDELSQSLPRLRELLSLGGLDLGGATVTGGQDQGGSRNPGAQQPQQPVPSRLPAFAPSADLDPAPRPAPRSASDRIDIFA